MYQATNSAGTNIITVSINDLKAFKSWPCFLIMLSRKRKSLKSIYSAQIIIFLITRSARCAMVKQKYSKFGNYAVATYISAAIATIV
jgi:hypothetical protein